MIEKKYATRPFFNFIARANSKKAYSVHFLIRIYQNTANPSILFHLKVHKWFMHILEKELALL